MVKLSYIVWVKCAQNRELQSKLQVIRNYSTNFNWPS